MEIVLQSVGTLAMLLVAFSGYIIVEAWYYQLRLGPALEREPGFREGTTYIRVGRRLHSAVAIKTVAEEGVFANAGFAAGDIFPELSHTALFKRLHRHRGSVVELTVVNGGQGPPFANRSKRLFKVAVLSHRGTE
ncbi:MAG: hypothetical protein ABGZ35_20995 [Planctomycetaceae bacterium]